MNLKEDILGCLDEVGYGNKCHSGKIFYKKGRKNITIRNGKNFPLNGFGFQTEDENSLIKFKPTSKTFDIVTFLCEVRICNMESKKIAALLQLLVNEYEENLEAIRNKKVRKRDIKKADVKEEIIKKKIHTLNHTINSLDNEGIINLIHEYEENGNISELIDLNNIKDEINDEKLLKFEKKKEQKKQNEKSNLYDFVSALTEKNGQKNLKKKKE